MERVRPGRKGKFKDNYNEDRVDIGFNWLRDTARMRLGKGGVVGG